MDTNYDEDIKKQFLVNYLSQLWTIQAFLPDMIKSNNGHLVTISSITAILDFPLISSYA
jgi:NADP-dependent 3-hydroxy acid dehydrogenase YdfG